MTKRNVFGQVEAIWTKRSHRGPMDPVSSVILTPESGVIGSVDRSRRRQVTLLDVDRWEAACRAVGGSAPPASRRANLLVRGIDLARTRGQVLLVGAAEIEIGGETTPCERMESVLPGLQRALRADWAAGAFGRVIRAGEVFVGDRISWAPSRVASATQLDLLSPSV